MSVRFDKQEDGSVRADADSIIDVLGLVRNDSAQDPYSAARIWPAPGAPEVGHAWAGPASSLAGYAKLIAKGDPEAARRVRTLAEKLTNEVPPPVEIRRRCRWKDDGDEVDLDRMKNGELDRMWWGATRSARTGSPIVRVLVNLSHSGGISASDLFWPGATAVALADILETAGWRVEIVAVCHGVNTMTNGQDVAIQIGVKRAEDPLDVETLAAVLANASALRTACFAMMIHGAASIGKQTRSGFGRPSTYKPGWAAPEDVWVGSRASEYNAQQDLTAALAKINERTNPEVANGY